MIYPVKYIEREGLCDIIQYSLSLSLSLYIYIYIYIERERERERERGCVTLYSTLRLPKGRLALLVPVLPNRWLVPNLLIWPFLPV